MIVDDEEDVAHLAARRIRSWGHEVVCLYEGNAALEAVRKEKPSLILLDIRLPDVSGVDVYRRIRGEKSLELIPIVFFSAHSSQEEYCLKELGAEGFIRKPYDPEEFRDTLSKLLGEGG